MLGVSSNMADTLTELFTWFTGVFMAVQPDAVTNNRTAIIKEMMQYCVLNFIVVSAFIKL